MRDVLLRPTAAAGSELGRRLVEAVRSRGVTAVSHHSAAHLHGLIPVEPALVHVLAVRGGHPTAGTDVIVHHTRWFDPEAVVHLDGVPVTDVASTIVMMAAYATRSETHEMIVAATRLDVTFDRLREVAEARRRRGRAGPGRLLAVLDAAAERSAA